MRIDEFLGKTVYDLVSILDSNEIGYYRIETSRGFKTIKELESEDLNRIIYSCDRFSDWSIYIGTYK